MSQSTIIFRAEQALEIVRKTLPLIQAYGPAAAAIGGPVGLGISAAVALLPLIEKIPVGELLTIDEQAALKSQVDDIVSGKAFEGSQWQKSTDTGTPAPAASAPEGEPPAGQS